MAIEIQLEKMHLAEAINARDTIAQRLADAYVSINQKNAVIENLRHKSGQIDSDVSNGTNFDQDEEKRKPLEDIRFERLLKVCKAITIARTSSLGLSATLLLATKKTELLRRRYVQPPNYHVYSPMNSIPRKL
jgi:hypothetical protein